MVHANAHPGKMMWKASDKAICERDEPVLHIGLSFSPRTPATAPARRAPLLFRKSATAVVQTAVLESPE
jgi:hypothetical protein